ncbi:MAG: superoxide dismutase family protein [Planctomycetota bacterium]
MNQDGAAHVDVAVPWLKSHVARGRSIVGHAGEDDLESQSCGNGGPRVALGVIGIAKPAGETDASGQ